MPVDLSKVPLKRNSAGLAYHNVYYEIQVTINGPELGIEIIYDKETVAEGEFTLKFD